MYSPEEPLSALAVCPAADVALSLPSTHCSVSRLKVTASPQGLRISPVSMRTLLSVVHIHSYAASPRPHAGLSSQEKHGLLSPRVSYRQEVAWKCLQETRQGSYSNSDRLKTNGPKARDMAHCARELALAENPHGGSQLPVQPPVPSGLHGYKAYMWCTDIHVAPHICT